MVEYQWNKNELGQDWETWKPAIVPQVTTYVDIGGNLTLLVFSLQMSKWEIGLNKSFLKISCNSKVMNLERWTFSFQWLLPCRLHFFLLEILFAVKIN